MKSHSLLSGPLNEGLMWFTLAVGSGLQQLVTLVLVILIWDEWPWPKFMLIALAIGLCAASTTGLYATPVLLAAKFSEDLCEPAGRTVVEAPLVLRPDKTQKDHFTGTRPIAA